MRLMTAVFGLMGMILCCGGDSSVMLVDDDRRRPTLTRLRRELPPGGKEPSAQGRLLCGRPGLFDRHRVNNPSVSPSGPGRSIVVQGTAVPRTRFTPHLRVANAFSVEPTVHPLPFGAVTQGRLYLAPTPLIPPHHIHHPLAP